MEIFLNIFQPFPFVEFTFTYKQTDYEVKLSFSHICIILMALRIYLTYKLMNHYTLWTNARSQRLAALQGIEANSIFATKVLLKNSPITVLIFIAVIFLFILSLLLRAFEFFDVSDKENDFRYLWNSLWLNFITMSTVGYGEYTPTTNAGKIFCIISCLMGNFLLSMLVAVLSLNVFLDSGETKVCRKIMEKDQIFSEMHLEMRDVFNLLSERFKKNNLLKISDELSFDGVSEEEALIKLLLRYKLRKLNTKKKLILKDEEDCEEKYIKQFDYHLDVHFNECSNKTVTIIKNQQKLYEISKNYSNFANIVSESKDYAYRITNLANAMSILSTCGKIQDIFDIEGGRLFTRKELVTVKTWNKSYPNKHVSKKKQVPNIMHSKSTVFNRP